MVLCDLESYSNSLHVLFAMAYVLILLVDSASSRVDIGFVNEMIYLANFDFAFYTISKLIDVLIS